MHLYFRLFAVKIIQSDKIFRFFLGKIDIDLIKIIANLMTFYFINPMNFNAEFQTSMYYLLHSV